jgi:hypothetical protein
LANILINPYTLSVHIIDYGRSTPADLPLATYRSEHGEDRWIYTTAGNAKVEVRDLGFLAGTSALMNDIVERNIPAPIPNSEWPFLERVYINAGVSAVQTAIAAAPPPTPPPNIPPPLIENPFTALPKPRGVPANPWA